MKKKIISSTIIHLLLFILVCFVIIFSSFKIYNYLIESSIKEEKIDYITVKTDKYIVECLDYYFDTKFYHDRITSEIYYPSSFLILKLKITNTSNEKIILTNDYKLTFDDNTLDLEYGFSKHKTDIDVGESSISEVAYLIGEFDKNIKEYFIDFDGNKMKLVFD